LAKFKKTTNTTHHPSPDTSPDNFIGPTDYHFLFSYSIPPLTATNMASLTTNDDEDSGMDMDMDETNNIEGGFEETKDNDDSDLDMEDVSIPPAPKPHGRYVVEIDRSRVRTGGQYAKSVRKAEKVILAPPTDVKKKDFAASLKLSGAHDVLSNAEVAILLNKYGDPNLSGNEVQKQTTSVFDSTLEYAKRFSGTKNPTMKEEYVVALRKDLEALRFPHEKSLLGEEEEYKIEPFEIAALCNLNLQEPLQIRALIPSLGRLDEEQLNNILDSIAKSAARR
jgi:hypothetical protein